MPRGIRWTSTTDRYSTTSGLLAPCDAAMIRPSTALGMRRRRGGPRENALQHEDTTRGLAESCLSLRRSCSLAPAGARTGPAPGLPTLPADHAGGEICAARCCGACAFPRVHAMHPLRPLHPGLSDLALGTPNCLAGGLDVCGRDLTLARTCRSRGRCHALHKVWRLRGGLPNRCSHFSVGRAGRATGHRTRKPTMTRLLLLPLIAAITPLPLMSQTTNVR